MRENDEDARERLLPDLDRSHLIISVSTKILFLETFFSRKIVVGKKFVEMFNFFQTEFCGVFFSFFDGFRRSEEKETKKLCTTQIECFEQKCISL
jgi:hypothetical protein